MDSREAGEWVRHFDTLLWTTTSILTAANGALLVYLATPDKFQTPLAVGGLWLTVVTVLIASSMREIRQRFQARTEQEVSDLISKDRRWYQWKVYLTLFVLLAAAWTWLLVRSDPSCWLPWSLLGLLAVAAVSIIGLSVDKLPERKPDA